METNEYINEYHFPTRYLKDTKKMVTAEELGDKAIKEVIEEYPKIGDILDKHGIGCTPCKVGICKLKDVVKIHFLPKEQEETIFKEINEFLDGQSVSAGTAKHTKNEEMDLTKDLVEEHKLIKKAIDLLEKAIGELSKGKEVEPIIFEQVTDFIKNFADKFHHAKEEDILFKELIKKGMPEKDSPIEAMLIEHDQGRNFVKGIVKGTEDLKKGNKDANKEIIENAKGYIELLREHIDKEDNILYPLAEKTFTKDEKDKQLDEYKKAEIEKGGLATVQKYKDLVAKLEEKGFK